MIKYNITTHPAKSNDVNLITITDIHKACRTGDLATIKYSYHCDPTQINTKDESLGWTPLFRTVIFGHVKATKFLLKHGANPNLVNTLGETPLHQSCDNSQYIISELLLSYKADPNFQQSEGDTPLHHACFRNDYKMIELLLRYGADGNIPNFLFKRTPMHFICEFGSEDSVMLMMQFKGDVHALDSQGKSPYKIASPTLQSCIDSFHLLGTVIVHESQIDDFNKEDEQDLPVSALSRWLENMGLGSYYQDFVSVEYEDLDGLLAQMNSVYPITLSELKKIGIDKLGHRYRILVKLEEDAGVFPVRHLKQSWQCCAVPRKTQFGVNLTSIDEWLDGIGLKNLKDTFLRAGFDDYGSLITQMKSRYPIDSGILEEIGVKSLEYRSRILASLSEDKEKGILADSSQAKTSCEFCLLF